MNVDEVLEVFREEMGTTQPQPLVEPTDVPAPEGGAVAAPAERPAAFEKSSELSSPLAPSGPSFKGLVVSIVCILLVVCIYVVKRVVDRYQRETVTEAVEVAAPLPDPSPEEAPVPASETASTEALPPLSTVATPATPPRSEATDAVKEQKNNATPTTSTTPTATATVEKKEESKPVAPVAVAPTTAPTPAPATAPPTAPTPVAEKKEEPKPAPAGRPLELVIEALDAVEIEYLNPQGEVVERLKLAADQVHTIRGRQGLKLKVSNGGAVNVIVNGKDMGVAGDLGKPTTRTY
jgi:cytoskeleton protein RodZ